MIALTRPTQPSLEPRTQWTIRAQAIKNRRLTKQRTRQMKQGQLLRQKKPQSPPSNSLEICPQAHRLLTSLTSSLTCSMPCEMSQQTFQMEMSARQKNSMLAVQKIAEMIRQACSPNFSQIKKVDSSDPMTSSMMRNRRWQQKSLLIGYSMSRMMRPLMRIGAKFLVSRIAAKMDRVMSKMKGRAKKNLYNTSIAQVTQMFFLKNSWLRISSYLMEQLPSPLRKRKVLKMMDRMSTKKMAASATGQSISPMSILFQNVIKNIDQLLYQVLDKRKYSQYLDINIQLYNIMIRKFSRVLSIAYRYSNVKPGKALVLGFKGRLSTASLCTPIRYSFSDLPKHQVLAMPALSPTMSEGKIVKWNKNVGDVLEEGDIICEVETDKATVGFEVTEKGFLAQKRETDKPIPVGTPLVVVVKKKEEVKNFTDFKFDDAGSGKKETTKSEKKQQGEGEKKPTKKKAAQEEVQEQEPKSDKKQSKSTKKTEKKEEKQSEQAEAEPEEKQGSPSASYPKHDQIKMPALSPTMAEGKIVKWNIKEGQQYSEGDSLCDIETDKATVAFEATEKGVLAKILAKENSQMKVGDVLGLSVKKKEDAGKFADYKAGGSKPAAKKPAKPAEKEEHKYEQEAQEEKGKQEKKPKKAKEGKQVKEGKQEKEPAQEKETEEKGENQGRVFASPAAKTLAGEKKINLKDIQKGSGPDGRIIRQDVEGYKPSKKTAEKQAPKQVKQQGEAKKEPTPSTPSKPKPKKVELPQNPFQEVALTNMRKTIAARLTESKTTIPHYYIQSSIEMDKANALRNELNQGEKENGVKISVNDIIIKAMALALRDYPNVNVQWHGSTVRKFRYADVSVAVATEGGLITPIVYRADTLGLLDIARRTKDIAKRAREGKLDPREYIGGTTTVSNVGMFGVDSVISVINPPQSTIVGVGKTEKKILFDEHSINPEKPFRVAEVMELTVSADHRVVDGAVASQWLSRIKKYLEHPSQMLL